MEKLNDNMQELTNKLNKASHVMLAFHFRSFFIASHKQSSYIGAPFQALAHTQMEFIVKFGTTFKLQGLNFLQNSGTPQMSFDGQLWIQSVTKTSLVCSSNPSRSRGETNMQLFQVSYWGDQQRVGCPTIVTSSISRVVLKEHRLLQCKHKGLSSPVLPRLTLDNLCCCFQGPNPEFSTLSIARLRNLAILTLRTLAPSFTSLRLLKLDSSRRMLSRLLASKTTLPWRESSDIPFKENDFKLELVRFTVNSASRNLMQSRDKDSRLLQLAMNDWSCNADASTLCSLRDNKHRNR